MSNISKIIVGQPEKSQEYLIQEISSVFPGLLERFQKFQTEESADFNAFLNSQAAKVNLLSVSLAKDKAKISVDEVQTILDFAQLKPHLTNQAFIIVNNAEKLSLEAQNQLLKILEEPPTFLQIFLVTQQAEKLIATIRSRAQIISLEPTMQTSQTIEEENLTLISEQFLQNKAELKKGYLTLRDSVEKLKQNPEKQALINNFIKIVNTTLNASLAGDNSRKLNLTIIRRISEILNTVNEANQANSNPKLLLDFLYNEFSRIV